MKPSHCPIHQCNDPAQSLPSGTGDTRTLSYVGEELNLFAHARQWKSYWSSQIARVIRGDVLEVGAGQGNNIDLITLSSADSWTALEPDPALLAQFEVNLRQTSPRCRVKARMGTLETLGDEEKFDTILYIDVLEHIADDLGELRHAATHLAPEGHLVVLSPAHPFLFSPFDTALGHYRRYTLASLIAVSPGSLKPVRLAYLDSAGLLASLANRLLLAQSIPRLSQILFWDRFLVRISKFMDPLLRHSLGKSVLGIWKRC